MRKDITASFGSSTTVATGVPLTIRFAVLDLANACEPYAGAAIYAWHCDQAGRYSMYTQGVEDENYLRGVQAAGDDGIVEFTSVFPACYPGRWPHIHFEVYPSLEAATSSANKIATSQIALPKDTSDAVYATSGYEQSVANMNGVSLERDNVFARRRRRHAAGHHVRLGRGRARRRACRAGRGLTAATLVRLAVAILVLAGRIGVRGRGRVVRRVGVWVRGLVGERLPLADVGHGAGPPAAKPPA